MQQMVQESFIYSVILSDIHLDDPQGINKCAGATALNTWALDALRVIWILQVK